MNKIINWLKESNRYKHLIGGIILGLISIDFYCTILLAVSVASTLEYKDIQWGGKWDWFDWIITIIGVLISFSIKCLMLL